MSYITKLPFEGKIKVTYPYGVKDSAYRSGYHQGIDMVGLDNKNVYSIANGVVSYAGWENAGNKKQGFGQYVSITFDKTSSGFKKVFLAHLDIVKVSAGQSVTNSTVVGTMGSTGFSTGPHTHIEIREYNSAGTLLKIVNAANYMGVPNNYGTIDSANYRTYSNSSNSSSASNNSNKYKVVASNGINFRKSFTTYAAKIGAIPNGTVLEVTETYKGQKWFWGKTTYNGNTGWFAIKTNNNKEVYAQQV